METQLTELNDGIKYLTKAINAYAKAKEYQRANYLLDEKFRLMGLRTKLLSQISN